LRIPRNLPVLAVAARPDSPSQDPMPQVMSQDYAQPGLSLAQIWCIAWAHRRQTLVITVAIVLTTAAITKIMPKTYAATATLMVNYESNDPLTSRGISTGPVQTYISTEMELMQSNDVLLPVVDKLNLTAIPYYTSGFSSSSGGGLRDWVREVLSKSLDIQQGRFGSQLIYITAAARDPVLAASIANTAADTYLEQQRQRVFGPASERAKNYARELAELKHKVSVAQEQVTAFRQRTGVTDTAAQASNVEADLLLSLEQRYQEAQNLERAAEVASGGDRTANAAALGPNLQTLKTQLAQLRSTMGPAHPKVMELENQIAALRRSLAEDVSSQLVAARRLRQKLAAAVEEQRAKVLGVQKLQDEGTKFVVELESAQSVYKRALDGYDQIMFASGDHYTNVNLVGRALPAMKAIKPNKPKLALVGALAGLLIGLAAPFAYELVFNRRVRCRDDFERGFGVPVLSEFDAIDFAPRSA
jgi:succinoglycan biosynthesis transport protein ExoP